MSEIFAEATVTLVPDTKGFARALQSQLKDVIGDIEKSARAPKIRVAPALTKDFIGSLRKQTNAAVVRAQKGVQPIRVEVALGALPLGQLREIQRASFRIQGALGGVATGSRSAAEANDLLADSIDRIPASVARGARDLSVFSTSVDDATGKGRIGGAKDSQKRAKDRLDETKAEQALAKARTTAASATSSFLSKEQRLSLLSRAATAFAQAEAIATKELTGNLSEEARIRARVVQSNANLLGQGINEQIDQETKELEKARQAQLAQSKALRANASDATKTARSHAQLRRGALATSLSFLGIRGATLAASASFLAGAAAISVFSKALQSSTQFADQLNVFRATTGATAAELESVRDSARALGADLSLPGVTASDAAEAMTELAKAGLDVQNSIDGARGVLQLATAAAIDNAQAVELVANALNAFSLQGQDATRVADAFANAANAAQGSIVDIGIAFQQSAAAGRQVGLSFQDTTEFLTILARAGLRGSDAGTSLRTALLRLIRPSKDAAAALKNLGIEVRDAQGNLRPDVFIQIAEATRNLAPAQRDATIALIGGQDAFRAISILGRQSIDDFIKLRRELRQQGTAADLAAARMQGLRGALEGLSNQLATVGIRIGQSLAPQLQGVVVGVSGFTTFLSESTFVAQTASGAIESLNIAFSALGATLSTLAPVLELFVGVQASVVNAIGVPTILAAVASYKLLIPLITGLGARAALAATNLRLVAETIRLVGARIFLQAALQSFNAWALAITAVSAGLFFLITRESEAERATRKLTEAVQGLTDAQQRLNQARAAEGRAGTDVNRARLAIFNAQEAVAAARRERSNTAPGTAERVRAELQLKVALDDVAAARQRLNEAEQAAADTRLIRLNAARRVTEELKAELEGLKATATAARLTARQRIGRVPDSGGLVEAETARNVTAALDKQIAKLRESDDAEALRNANRLERLKTFIALTKQVPTERALDIVVNAPDMKALTAGLTREFGISGAKALAALQFVLSGEGSKKLRDAFNGLINSIGFSDDNREHLNEIGREMARAVRDGVVQTAPEVADAFAGIIARATGRLQGLERQGRQLEIEGASPAARLANARAQEKAAQDILDRLRARGANEGKITAQQNVVLEKIRAREAIEEEIRTAQKESDDKAKKAADEADQAALDRLERRRGNAQERITDAQDTETLADDLRSNIRLRNLVHKQINRIKELVKDRKTQIDAIRTLQKIERDVNREIASVQKQRRQQIKDRIAESIQLDIDFANTTGNRSAEIRARLREIERLKKLQAATKRGTVEYKRLRNLIAEQEKAIKDLRDAQKKKNDAFASMTFQFLQAQSGFAANLLGNLIPQGATTGLVGVPSPGRTAGGGGGTTPLPFHDNESLGPRLPGATGSVSGGSILGFHDNEGRGPQLPGAVKKALATDTGARAGGPTRGGQATEIHLLRQIRTLLGDIKRGTGHPEAHYRRTEGPKRMDIRGD